jgi:drug/metabolite transporter (DMT)-like permease
MKRLRWTIICAAVAFVGGFALVVPLSGIDTDPPECYSGLGYVVPCGSGFAASVAVAAALLVALGSLVARREIHTTQ